MNYQSLCKSMLLILQIALHSSSFSLINIGALCSMSQAYSDSNCRIIVSVIW